MHFTNIWVGQLPCALRINVLMLWPLLEKVADCGFSSCSWCWYGCSSWRESSLGQKWQRSMICCRHSSRWSCRNHRGFPLCCCFYAVVDIHRFQLIAEKICSLLQHFQATREGDERADCSQVTTLIHLHTSSVNQRSKLSMHKSYCTIRSVFSNNILKNSIYNTSTWQSVGSAEAT